MARSVTQVAVRPALSFAIEPSAFTNSPFITHHHSDHVRGLQDLVLTHWTMDRTDAAPPLPVIAPEGPSSRYVEQLLDGWEEDIEVRQSHGDVVVAAGQVRHEPCPNSVGYRVDTPDGSVAITGDTRVCVIGFLIEARGCPR